jgi:hypothetical protein
MANKITAITRRDILDLISLENIVFHGRLSEIEFLERIWDLKSLPSSDSRFENALADIYQHTVNNDDWGQGWVFTDSRFHLMDDDDLFLKFLCETIHPVVRSELSICTKLCQLYNDYLQNDGYQIVEKTQISGRSVYHAYHQTRAAFPGLDAVKKLIDSAYVAKQISRMESAISNDPELAIGTAKELIETCCKSILEDCKVPFSKGDDLPKLVSLTAHQLELTPSHIPSEAKAGDTIKKLLGNLAYITQGIAELRNHYGTGHGKLSTTKGLQERHARLATGSAATLSVFLMDTHKIRKSS